MGRYFPYLPYVAYVASVCAVLPLAAPDVWTGFRLGLANSVLAALSPSEQALSVRTPGGQWAMLLALAWFALAYWQRNVRWWEPLLVVLGGAAALVRAGNGWLDALLLIVPLARHTALAKPPAWMLAGIAAVSLAYAGFLAWSTRPPALPPQAADATSTVAEGRTVFADWRWAAQLQARLPNARVLPAGGLASESGDFWLNYVKILSDYEKWPGELQAMNADVVVLNSASSNSLADQVRSSSDWHVIYDTGDAFVAERST